MAQDTNDDFHHELHAVTNPAPRVVTPQLGVLFHAKQRTGNTRAGTSTSIKVSFIRSGPARTSILFFYVQAWSKCATRQGTLAYCAGEVSKCC